MKFSVVRLAVISVFAGGLAIANLGDVLAHGGATGIVKKRMDGMSAIASQMKIIGQMAQGRTDFDADAARVAADALTVLALEIPDQFPENNLESPSDARAEIWQDWERFSILAEMLVIASDQLSVAAPKLANAQDMRPHLQAIGKACQGCHKDFRN